MRALRNVFISSTTSDLKNERRFLYNKILSLSSEYIEFKVSVSEIPGSFKITEDQFAKSDSVEMCLRQVDICSYFVLLIKEKYALKAGNPISVTEMEYNRAKEMKKPIIVFVFKNVMAEPLAKDFIDRVSNEKWRYGVKNVQEVWAILSKLFPSFDSSTFISESPFDGMNFKKGATINKTWTIKNSGCQIWQGRYMMQVSSKCALVPSEEKIYMPTIYPDEQYVFSVDYLCKSQGEYYSCWKMYNENNQPCFPTEYKGLWINAKIL